MYGSVLMFFIIMSCLVYDPDETSGFIFTAIIGFISLNAITRNRRHHEKCELLKSINEKL